MDHLSIDQALLPRYLIKMRDKGLINSVYRDNYIYYSPADPALGQAVQSLLGK
ncbi:helix-turn-helix domain-containing protein [Spirosoma validum]|uniref:Helix-turn-helix transcriptional regulator n=1 Tax=Spirosoma validum TaxID=2771355 RepID=A0A927GBP5_9BACT|nr:helix-turn-helix domain-containing protein [Spirosoma validum]MBD2751927.1 helix-turn-helix transcriptional regulator [Spirosoma validum]